ncbi:VanZ family protein [Flagellimonas halotolerans]|uniref:VanZ family protein n=1 Tax=Flagellimonas halotolerans TaxID=3112164 RepID=A0ABU6IMM9_9FLAO|nr:MULTISPECIES: VanZ family protein [unclassified Allomuricauda]MEC3964431.1 VanZ family protein [Muricauda sp. SYSU M86414]MEC4264301.1 VanZ family protein [Muricauda sp. SYSU M84420]
MFVSWVIVITMLSLFSFSDMDLDTGNLNIPYADKITHFIFYMVFGFVGCLSFRERTKGGLGLGKTTKIVVGLAIVYGMIIEVLQYAVTTDRMAEIGDFLANALGAFAGIGLIMWVFSKKNPLKWKF